MQKYFFDLPIEIFLIIIHFPSELFKIFVNLDNVNPNPTKENDIIIVERWFTKNILHTFLKKFLEKQGFRVFWINYPLTKGSFSIASISLQKFIEKNNLNNIILIGISGGGVTCIEYLQHLDGWKKVKKFISIASPIYGTSMAFLVSFFKSGKELSPNSSYINH